ncbi:peptidoglycan-binding protein [Candidatus Peregrinibacteria bacterium]|nr:peptidoglycan-binding protein [Candidatus Peregrinibacteria bacterium]
MKTKFFSVVSAMRGIRIIFWITLGILLLFAVTPRGYAQSAENSTANSAPQNFPYTKTFVISSYYTPLPNQSRYITGSFEGDVRLNGEGVHSADGTLVYPGMAASSREYPFGTKMEIPGFGTVAIHDRGGAIKGNRLDIWMGEGEEGLRRALWWGMRTLEVKVYGIDSNIQESVNIAGIPLADIRVIPERSTYFKTDLAVGDDGPQVHELQRFLKKLGYFKNDVTGYFGAETNAALTQFQIDRNVIPNGEDSGAGNFGPRSRYALEAILEEKRDKIVKQLPSPGLRKGSKGETVKNVQEVLFDLGFLKKENVTGNFEDKTLDAVLRFQIDADLIHSPKDFGAGIYGPKTKAALESFVAQSYTPSQELMITRSLTPLSKTVFTQSLELNSKGAQVALLQDELKRLHFFGLEPTGYFGKVTQHAVFKFQQTFGIVEKETDFGSGIAGPKTLEKLNDIASARQNQKKTVAQTTEQKEVVAARLNDEKSLVVGVVAPNAFAGPLLYGSRGSDVDRLQKVLKRLGFFPGRMTTEYYGDITKNSVTAFQKSHGLDASGNVDAKTLRILNQLVSPPQSS